MESAIRDKSKLFAIRIVKLYRYLPKSIAAVPQGDDMLQLMRNAGLRSTQFKRLTLGTCTIYTAVK